MNEPTHVVHWAGVPVRAASVIRQRCQWCGALIDEVDLDRVAWQDDGTGENPFVNDDGTPKGRWSGLVAIAGAGEGTAGTTAMWAVDDPSDGKIPPDSCMALDPAVTS